jgi:hypothetical protein
MPAGQVVCIFQVMVAGAAACAIGQDRDRPKTANARIKPNSTNLFIFASSLINDSLVCSPPHPHLNCLHLDISRQERSIAIAAHRTFLQL